MLYPRITKTMQKGVWLLSCVCNMAITNSLVSAAPQWTDPNRPTASMVALYHFDQGSSKTLEATVRAGIPEGTHVTHQMNHPVFGPDFALEFYNFNSDNAGYSELSSDVAAEPLQSSSLALNGIVQYRAKSRNASVNTNHFTAEAWVKWDDTATSSDLTLGGSDRSIRIIRDPANPANDAVGFQASHGGWRPHPGFTGFDAVQDPVIDGQWFHVAMVIHSAGMHEHSGHWHYNEGTFALIFINGHLVGQGTANDRIDISEHDHDLVFHGSDRIQIRTSTALSRILVDEFTVWHDDPTHGGTVTNGLFDNGRGSVSSASDWILFE